jgi:alkanesulfonate monooxygenase SsuD/methylene tetrahydromethanopterin reductase-like flavin-dependent oxidoreductase (luciferase family)
MTVDRRLRLGFFTYLEGNKPQAETYAETMEIIVAADELGFDTAWVAQHHFGHHGGLPSPFVFFASAAERTRQLSFGTAVVTLPLEDPIRVAEDAAVFEALYPGRLQLGVGTGFATPQTMSTFGRDGIDRRELYHAALDRLMPAFEGQPLNDDGDTLNPPAPSLRHRIWESPAHPDRVAEAARRGNGLLLSRVAIGTGLTPTPEVQVPLVNRYLENLPSGVEPRIGLSRSVYPTRRPEIALRDLTEGIQASLPNQIRQNPGLADLTMPELFTHYNIHHGSPDAVIETLSREPLLDQITDLICQVSPGIPSLSQTLEAIELLATEVAPAIGWQPARESAEVSIR